jgi:hypothetical protein
MGTQEDLDETVGLVEKAGRRMIARVAGLARRSPSGHCYRLVAGLCWQLAP